MRPPFHPITPYIYKQARCLLPRISGGRVLSPESPPYRTETFLLPSPAEIREERVTMTDTIPSIVVWWEPCFRAVQVRDEWGLKVKRQRFSHWQCLNPVVADEYFEVPT